MVQLRSSSCNVVAIVVVGDSGTNVSANCIVKRIVELDW
jgi:hypothetical protein